jgi:K+-transporting ATPase ATPase A chain
MDSQPWLQVLLYCVLLAALAKPLGLYMARVFENKPCGLDRVLGPVEKGLYRLCGVKADQEMNWKVYALAFVLFNAVGGLVLYALMRLQAHLPLNPDGQSAVGEHLSFNTAMSFITNTNWQSYGGETTMSYLTQMAGLTVHNFVSAAGGMAVLVALIRGLVRHETTKLGNFWVDLTRSTLYILLPLSFIFALVLIGQGMPQTFHSATKATLLQATSYDQPVKGADGQPVMDAQGLPKVTTTVVTEQTLAMGPVASQVAIKQLGTNGGGFYNVNSAHPYENPTPLSNFLETLALVLIPAALCYTFGVMIKDRRQGWALLAAMFLLFIPPLLVCVNAERSGNPALTKLTTGANGTVLSSGNLEGKEVRVGVTNSALWATATTAVSNGSVNSMHDSFTPLGGLVPMWMMMLGEVVFGGVGSGLYGMLAFVILAVFIAGLMVGRTPEYLGKKIQAYEMKMASLIILIPPLLILASTAFGVITDAGRAGIMNPGAHGFSEVLYAFVSMGNNNGSAFAGLTANAPFYDLLGGSVMWVVRFWLAVPILAIAGSLAQKKIVPESVGTLPTHTPLFIILLAATVVIVGALTFFPALALGPIVEHLQMIAANLHS